MSLWTSSVISLLLLQTAQLQTPQINGDKPAEIEEAVTAREDPPPRPLVIKKDWDLTQAYSDVYKILSDRNTCSSFYGGPRAATTVLNDFAPLVERHTLLREISFQMKGPPRVIRNTTTGTLYRLFNRAVVNSNGSFYQRRLDPMRKFPSDVGRFAPGSRPARALILLHELGHLIEGEDGSWLLPDDGLDAPLSKENTLRVQQACRAQLEAIKQ
jgi:hypothetical protein